MSVEEEQGTTIKLDKEEEMAFNDDEQVNTDETSAECSSSNDQENSTKANAHEDSIQACAANAHEDSIEAGAANAHEDSIEASAANDHEYSILGGEYIDEEDSERTAMLLSTLQDDDDDMEDGEMTGEQQLIDQVINDQIASDLRQDQKENDTEEWFLEMVPGLVPKFDYTCNLCEYSAKSGNGPFYHNSLKPRNPNYPCDMCKFVASTLDNLCKHKESVTPAAPSKSHRIPIKQGSASQLPHRRSSHSYTAVSSNSVSLLLRQQPGAVAARLPMAAAARSPASRSLVAGRPPAVTNAVLPITADGAIIPVLPPVSFSSIKHTVNGVHPCNECEFVGGNSHALKKHKNTRHSLESFTCPSMECDYVTHDQTNLKLHIQIKHDGVRFPCHLCNFFATRKSTLKTHIASIHEGIKYPCDLCTYAATQKSALKRHMRTIHNPEHPKRIGYFGHKAIGNLDQIQMDQIQAIQYSTGP